jgi:accessory gene regulator B
VSHSTVCPGEAAVYPLAVFLSAFTDTIKKKGGGVLMHSISDKFAEKVIENNNMNELDSLKIRYAIASLKSELTKTILFIIIFYLLGSLNAFLFTMLLIVPVRVFTGGLHFKTDIGCFLSSLSFFLLSVLILPQVPLSAITYQVILLISAVCIWLCPLAPSSKRPIKKADRYLFNKYLSVLYSVGYVIIFLFVLYDQYLIRCGIWAFCLQALQLLLLGMNQIYRRRYCHD